MHGIHISFSILAMAALITIFAMLYAAGWQISLGQVGFGLWALSPYALLALAMHVVGSESKPARIAGLFASGSVLLFAVLFYLGAVFASDSSTSGLVFLFGPLYQAIGGLVIFFTITIVGKRLSARRDT